MHGIVYVRQDDYKATKRRILLHVNYNLSLTAKASIIRLTTVQWKLLLSVTERKRRKSKEVAHTRQTINEPAAMIMIRGLEQQRQTKHRQQHPVFPSTATCMVCL